jgi:hypothetical protein
MSEGSKSSKMSGSNIAALVGAIFAVLVMLLFFSGAIKAPTDYKPDAPASSAP